MKEFRVLVTQKVLDYIEKAESGKLDGFVWSAHVPKPKIGNYLGVYGANIEFQRLLLTDGKYECTLPINLFDDFDLHEFQKECKKRDELEKEKGHRQEYLRTTDWVSLRNKTAVAVLQGLTSNKAVRVDEEDNDPEELEKQSRTVKRCAYTAVKYANALIEELKNNVL